jgi:hypothetical protein
MRRGKNALPASESWPTFIFPASGEDIANLFASSAFLLPSLSRRLETIWNDRLSIVTL